VRLAYVLSQRVGDPAARDAEEVLLYPAPYAPTLAAACSKHHLSPATLLGLMRQESAFDPAVDSGAGARGLMQIMPEVGRRLWPAGERQPYHADVLYQPDTNIALGCKLLAAEIQRARGDVPQALAAYNAGGDAAESWARRLGPQDPPEMYVDLVEYSETRNYLKTVLGNIENYRRLYALP
jgi:soluble lytic murein transglycosylase